MRGIQGKLYVVGVIVLCTADSARADESLREAFGDAAFVSIATGREQPVAKAPAVTTVVTREQIEISGKTSLGEILDVYVPGFHNLFRFQGDQFIVRGVRTKGNFSPDVLVMIDGVPQNDAHLANQRRFISQVPLVAIERIEVVLGPYSTLYGQDAFSGAINIITRDVVGIDAAEYSVRAGSFDTLEGRLLQPIPVGPLGHGAVLSAQVRRTDGHEPPVERDTQTAFDEIFGTNASNAPGDAHTDYRDYNILLDYYPSEDLLLRARARGHEVGMGRGLLGALDPDGHTRVRQHNAELHYESEAGHWRRELRASYWQYAVETEDVHAFPAGAFGGRFPDGIIDNPGYKERQAWAEALTLYEGFEDHLLRFGAGYSYIDVFDVNESRNYLVDPDTAQPIAPLPSVQPVPEPAEFSEQDSREVLFAHVQDEWFFARDWSITGGVRVDRYSDMGTSVNPRLGVVWATTSALNTKLLAGRGFRAPTLFEQNAQNQPSQLGNADLEPVTIRSVELAFDYDPTQRVRGNLSVFRHEIDDIIEFEPIAGAPQDVIVRQARNAEGQTGYGLEADLSWRPTSALTLSGYYAYQHNQREADGGDSGLGPRHKARLRVNWSPAHNLTVFATGAWVADRQRQADDPRDPVDDYAYADLALEYRPFDGFTGQLAVNNVFDANRVAPDERLSQDTLLAGRNVFLWLRARF